jgi:hypothetical protein
MLLCSHVSGRELAFISAWAYPQPANAMKLPVSQRGGAGFFMRPVLRAEVTVKTGQAFLKKEWEKREGQSATYRVKAIKPIEAQGAKVLEGAFGSLTAGIIKWDDGALSEDINNVKQPGMPYRDRAQLVKDCIARSTDYILAQNILPEKVVGEEEIWGEASEADVNAAFSDLSGLGPGDALVVRRSDGTWAYAKAIDKYGTSRSKTGAGIALKVKVGPETTKVYAYEDWDQVKQLNPPKPDGAWAMSYPKDLKESLTGKMTDARRNALLSKIGQECAEEDLTGAQGDMSSVRSGDMVAVLRSDGKWTYARVKQFIGAARDTKDVGLKFGAPDKVSSDQAGVGVLLRVDFDGSEKKVMSDDFDKVKPIAK